MGFLLLDILKKIYKNDENPAVETTLSNITLVYSEFGQNQKSLNIYKKFIVGEFEALDLAEYFFYYLDIQKKKFNTEEHADVANTLNQMALINYSLKELKDPSTARKNFKKALSTNK